MASNTAPVEDHLDDDVFTVPGQNFALVSFVSPEGRQKNDKFGMKIRGVFATKEDASAHIRKIRRFDTTMDVYLVELWKWLLIPPPSNPLDLEHADIEYDQQFLQDLVSGYKKNQELAKDHFHQRKKAIMEDGLDAHLTEEERLPAPPAEALANPASIFEEEDVFVSARVRAAAEAKAKANATAIEEIKE